jgi:hypothetical protein
VYVSVTTPPWLVVEVYSTYETVLPFGVVSSTYVTVLPDGVLAVAYVTYSVPPLLVVPET